MTDPMLQRHHFTAYVAGRTSDVERVRQVQAWVRELGGTITFDWTGPEGEIRKDWAMAQDRAYELSTREREAVTEAGVTILCSPPDGGGLGCYIEVGMATAHKRLVIVYGEIRESVFWYLPEVMRATDATELRLLLLGVANTREAA